MGGGGPPDRGLTCQLVEEEARAKDVEDQTAHCSSPLLVHETLHVIMSGMNEPEA